MTTINRHLTHEKAVEDAACNLIENDITTIDDEERRRQLRRDASSFHARIPQ